MGFVLGTALAISACASAFSSSWRSRDVTIDGAQGDWKGFLETVGEEEISLGVSNDADFLYVSLLFENQARQAQILSKGCTIWLDATAEKQKTFGIHYPQGLGEKQQREFLGKLLDGGDADSLVAAFQVLPDRIEITGEGPSGPVTLKRGTAGVEVAVKTYDRALVYELKVPLAAGPETPHAIGAAPGQRISVGIECPAIGGPGGGPGGEGRGPGGPPGGGSGGRGGPPPGGEGGSRPGGRGGPGGFGGPPRGGPSGGPGNGRGSGLDALELWESVRLGEVPGTD